VHCTRGTPAPGNPRDPQAPRQAGRQAQVENAETCRRQIEQGGRQAEIQAGRQVVPGSVSSGTQQNEAGRQVHPGRQIQAEQAGRQVSQAPRWRQDPGR